MSVWFITSCTCLLLRFNVQTWLKCNAFLPECRHISKSLAGTLMDSAGSLSLNLFISFWYSTSGTFRPCGCCLTAHIGRGSHESGSCFQTTSSVLVLRHLWDTIWHHHDTHPPTSNMLYEKQSSHWWQFKRWNFLFSILFMFERTIQIYTLTSLMNHAYILRSMQIPLFKPVILKAQHSMSYIDCTPLIRLETD